MKHLKQDEKKLFELSYLVLKHTFRVTVCDQHWSLFGGQIKIKKNQKSGKKEEVDTNIIKLTVNFIISKYYKFLKYWSPNSDQCWPPTEQIKSKNEENNPRLILSRICEDYIILELQLSFNPAIFQLFLEKFNTRKPVGPKYYIKINK
ncbi:hypothetical protein BpHYR1_030484 [Brachionus plicatilis]|uniref:Uncharacterized protein n=1 Tax=Brachionus plicatilis TaxID=10195 RepID=A0A3M7PE69_BRAPC|nr:hypothetical protein BpHYR1_030484 [Brachionus plicatilis]